MSPQCATGSISMLPGGGSFQSAKVRTATRRPISGVTRRGFLVRVALRGARSNRSIVAALIVSTLVRMGFFPQHDQRLLRSLVVDRTVEDSNGDISREATKFIGRVSPEALRLPLTRPATGRDVHYNTKSMDNSRVHA